MPLKDALLAIMVTFIWGSNFVVIHYGLQYFPPFLFAALRFTLIFLPWAFFFKKPILPWRYLILHGFFLGFGQFGLLFFALRGHITPGLASLLMQSQIFFSLVLAALIFKERPNIKQQLALVISMVGFLFFMINAIIEPTGDLTLLGLMLCLIASLSWSTSNLLVRKMNHVNMMSLIIWGSLFSSIPLFGVSLFIEGPQAIIDALHNSTFTAWLSVLWQSLGNTLLGFSLWFWLMHRHGTSLIAPLSLLVPVFGILFAYLFLNESFSATEWFAALLILSGLSLNMHFAKVNLK